jgi:hypothetical protein
MMGFMQRLDFLLTSSAGLAPTAVTEVNLYSIVDKKQSLSTLLDGVAMDNGGMVK